MDYRLPYYMAYPMPMEYDDEKVEQRDFDYMKSMYPETARRLLPYVEEECDRMSYEGSVIYDEYPDQLQIRLMCSRIYEKVKDMDEIEDEMEMTAQQHQDRRGQKDNRFKDLIQIILFQELFRRRNRHRRNRRRFY